MLFEFKLPDIGEGVVEGELVKWLVEQGEQVEEDTPLFEVLTDKVSAVIPSPHKGVVAKRFFEEGDVVPVGGVVVSIETTGDAAASTVAPTPEPATAAPTTPATPAALPPKAAAPAAPPARSPAASASKPANRVRATPATRKLARTLGVDIQIVEGTGDHGRVTREDVQRWAADVASTPAARAPAMELAPAKEDEVRKLLGMRRKISQSMRYSKDTAAHFTYVDEVDFTEISAMKNALRQRGVKTTFLPFVMKAVVSVLKQPEFELLNAHVNYDKGEILVKRSYNLGIAAATDAGLMVPVIFDVDRKNMRGLVDELNALGEGARTGKLAPGQLSGSSFTITSLGRLGGMFATPIINAPEVAILGLHKIEKRPVVVDGEIVIRERMYMSCSFDHRLIDGHVGAAFVQAVKDLLESPALLLAELA
jgi:pyruvate dehydrogenase E2 component (dihydrolipoamide acetyltransferase)